MEGPCSGQRNVLARAANIIHSLALQYFISFASSHELPETFVGVDVIVGIADLRFLTTGSLTTDNVNLDEYDSYKYFQTRDIMYKRSTELRNPGRITESMIQQHYYDYISRNSFDMSAKAADPTPTRPSCNTHAAVWRYNVSRAG